MLDTQTRPGRAHTTHHTYTKWDPAWAKIANTYIHMIYIMHAAIYTYIECSLVIANTYIHMIYTMHSAIYIHIECSLVWAKIANAYIHMTYTMHVTWYIYGCSIHRVVAVILRRRAELHVYLFYTSPTYWNQSRGPRLMRLRASIHCYHRRWKHFR